MFNVTEKMKELELAGFTKSEAEAAIKVLLDIMNDEFSTKNDLNREITSLRHDMQLEFANVRHEMKEEFANVRHEMKEEFANVRHEMQEEFANVRHEMQEEFANVRHEIKELETSIATLGDKLTIRLGAMMTAGLALIFGMLQLMR